LLQRVCGVSVGDGTRAKEGEWKYRVLGPLEVLDATGRKLPLGGAMQQCVLASLFASMS